MKEQQQFLDVVDCETARARFAAALSTPPLSAEEIELTEALGRVLAEDVVSAVDVPGFDRSNFDGFAVVAQDVEGADEEQPCRLTLLEETAAAGEVPRGEVRPGTAMPISTGGVLPRGADAVVMIEDTRLEGGHLAVQRPVAAGFGIAFAGTDIAAGECVLLRGTRLSSRDTAVLAAVGCSRVRVIRRPRIGVLSTGDEIVSPGAPLKTGQIYDSNQRVIADAIRELGGDAIELGIVADDEAALRAAVQRGLEECDGVLLSGGTSKGAGDVSYRVVEELGEVCAHGVAIKPGKPICLGVSQGKPLVVLPGFPTSAVFTFHEFVGPVLRRMAGLPVAVERAEIEAELAVPVRSQIGRREYLLVSLIEANGSEAAAFSAGAGRPTLPAAYPLGKGSGSVTTFSHADGFVTIDQRCELLGAGERVSVRLLASGSKPAELVVIGSHCVGLDWLLSQVSRRDVGVKFLAVGSLAGLEAIKQGRCDLTAIHLLDAATGRYNTPFLSDELLRIGGYQRVQGIVFRGADERFVGRDRDEIRAHVVSEGALRMVNRNAGSGTRILIDQWLAGARPHGYAVQPRTHHAVVAAVAQGRADWGVAVEWVARRAGLGFCPLQDESYDFVARRAEMGGKGLNCFREVLADGEAKEALRGFGFHFESEPLR